MYFRAAGPPAGDLRLYAGQAGPRVESLYFASIWLWIIKFYPFYYKININYNPEVHYSFDSSRGSPSAGSPAGPDVVLNILPVTPRHCTKQISMHAKIMKVFTIQLNSEIIFIDCSVQIGRVTSTPPAELNAIQHLAHFAHLLLLSEVFSFCHIFWAFKYLFCLLFMLHADTSTQKSAKLRWTCACNLLHLGLSLKLPAQLASLCGHKLPSHSSGIYSWGNKNRTKVKLIKGRKFKKMKEISWPPIHRNCMKAKEQIHSLAAQKAAANNQIRKWIQIIRRLLHAQMKSRKYRKQLILKFRIINKNEKQTVLEISNVQNIQKSATGVHPKEPR